MADRSPTVRPIETDAALEAAVASMVDAFRADPLSLWMHGHDPDGYPEDFRRVARAIGRSCMEAGTALQAEDGAAAAFWMPPGRTLDEQSLGPLVHEATSPALRADADALFAWTDAQAPAGWHWFLAMLGVHPDVQGQGLGSALLDEGLRRAASDGCPAYLWSCNPRSIALYRRHGFVVTADVSFGSSPPATAMTWRAAAA